MVVELGINRGANKRPRMASNVEGSAKNSEECQPLKYRQRESTARDKTALLPCCFCSALFTEAVILAVVSTSPRRCHGTHFIILQNNCLFICLSSLLVKKIFEVKIFLVFLPEGLRAPSRGFCLFTGRLNREDEGKKTF